VIGREERRRNGAFFCANWDVINQCCVVNASNIKQCPYTVTLVWEPPHYHPFCFTWRWWDIERNDAYSCCSSQPWRNGLTVIGYRPISDQW